MSGAATKPAALATGQWAGDEVYVVGSGPSRSLVDIADLDRRCDRGEVRIIAVNHACHDTPHADIVFSKDLGLYRDQPEHPKCCNDLGARSRGLCVYSLHSSDWGYWVDALPELMLIREWPRSGVGQCGPWPRSLDEPIVTCGCSGTGAICLADMLCGGDPASRIHLVGLDMDRDPYTRWAGWFVANGYAGAVRTPVVVHGGTTLDPEGRWRRA